MPPQKSFIHVTLHEKSYDTLEFIKGWHLRTAYYGLRDHSEGVDVTAKAQSLWNNRKAVMAGNHLFGDPSYGKRKVLHVTLESIQNRGSEVEQNLSLRRCIGFVAVYYIIKKPYNFLTLLPWFIYPIMQLLKSLRRSMLCGRLLYKLIHGFERLMNATLVHYHEALTWTLDNLKDCHDNVFNLEENLDMADTLTTA